MDAAIAQRLVELNRQFYQTFGADFSATRRRLQPGVKKVLGTVSPDDPILDLGCGNGELARLLAGRGQRASYTGLDFSLPLLREAGGLPAHFVFIEADLTGDWEVRFRDSANQRFNVITAFATLHHIPSETLRLQLLEKVHTVLEPKGRFIHSNWQFLNSEKLKARIQPWERVGLSAVDVDENDYLLDWRRGGEGLRYVHHFDEAELNAMATASGFQVREMFRSDGENGQLGLYQIWEVT
jgi:SAM-dependent methyltransferase